MYFISLQLRPLSEAESQCKKYSQVDEKCHREGPESDVQKFATLQKKLPFKIC